MKKPSIDDICDKLEFNKKPLEKGDKLYIFGRNPELSLGELISRFHGIKSEFFIKKISRLGIIITSNNHISIDNCGSILKKCNYISSFDDIHDKSLRSTLEEFTSNIYFEEKGYWTISEYNREENANAHEISIQIHQEIKKSLKKSGIRKAFFFRGENDENARPRKLWRKNILYNGLELIIWYNDNEFILFQTEQIIDIDGISRRDTERPHKRLLLLLGLSLARSMINLISIESNKHQFPIYDPFCGMGSIVSEAYLIDVDSYGSDIDISCVERSKGNLQWYSKNKKKFGKKKPYDITKIFQMDITNPISDIFQDKIISIVAEPNLLNPLQNFPSLKEADQMINQFKDNYISYLKGIHKILDDDGVCVLIFPQIHADTHEKISLPIEDILKKLNFKICTFKINPA